MSTSATRLPALALNRGPSLAAAAAEKIKQAIIDREIPLGGELSEVKLAEQLGVSRTPVREALNILQLQGLVVIVPQKGSYVFFPTEDDVVELCEYRIAIEQRAIYFALSRGRDAVIADLEGVISGMEAAREQGDDVAYWRYDTEFHKVFIRHSGNRYLQEAYNLVEGKISTLRSHFSGPLEGVQERSFNEHKLLTKAFERGDIVDLDSLLVKHIRDTREAYLLSLQRGLAGPK
jgi:DNA-binding GntR family transcriptional regulator